MAEDSAQEKTEEATQHKRDQAIEQGNLAHSKELVTAVTVALIVLALPLIHPMVSGALQNALRLFLNFDDFAARDFLSFRIVMIKAVWVMIPAVAPVFLLVMFAGVAGNVLQIGWKVSPKKLEPKPEKLDPIKGLERVVGRRAAAEAVRSVAKFLIIGLITVLTLKGRFHVLLGMHAMPVTDFIPLLVSLLWHISWRVAALMIAFAILDFGYQRWDWARRLRMSRQELKEEMKEREGNPLVKQRIRSIQMEQARKRMMADVPSATAVVTNPTHCAVAVRYRAGDDRAPRVVAKGVDHLAKRIREVAREHGVPCLEDKPTAWALYRGVKIGHEIPAHLYRAVAEILAFVFRMGGVEHIDRVQRRLDARRGPDA